MSGHIRRSGRTGGHLVLAVTLLLSLLPISVPAVSAAAFTVDSTEDVVDAAPGDGTCVTSTGVCTLRAAIMETNALAGADTIQLPAGTYVLTIEGTEEDAASTGDLDVTGSLHIVGAGDAVTIIDGNDLDRVLHVIGSDTSVKIVGVEITGGAELRFGGGIFNQGSQLTLEWSTVSDNFADSEAGGIFSEGGELTLRDVLIVGNDVGMGGAGLLSVGGAVHIERAVVIENGNCAPTGGIRSWGSETVIADSYIGFNNGNPCGDVGGVAGGGDGSLLISGTTIEGNYGGGVAVEGGEAFIVNTTITANYGAPSGGGVQVWSGHLSLRNATIAENSSSVGGGIYKQLGTFVDMANSIVWGNIAGDGIDCYNTIQSLDYNLIGEMVGCTLAGGATHDITGVEARLGPLQDNGGLTDTLALLAGSPALNAGNPATPGSGDVACAAVDQRGVTRPQGDRCDIGAFEAEDLATDDDPVDSFVDDDGSIFEPDIEWLAAAGITRGCNPPANDRFCPDDFVTRGQMAAFLVRAFGYTDDGGSDLFVDDDASVFQADIDRLGTAGVTRGCNPPANDRFCPDDFVTRGQMAAFLVRAFGYSGDGGGDVFVDDDGSVFEADIDRLGTAGVTRGCNPPANDRFCPDDFVTRGQMAAFLHRAFSG